MRISGREEKTLWDRMTGFLARRFGVPSIIATEPLKDAATPASDVFDAVARLTYGDELFHEYMGAFADQPSVAEELFRIRQENERLKTSPAPMPVKIATAERVVTDMEAAQIMMEPDLQRHIIINELSRQLLDQLSKDGTLFSQYRDNNRAAEVFRAQIRYL